MYLLANDVQMREGEAAETGAAGVDVENTSALFNGGFMGVAAYYDVEAGAGGTDVDFFGVVKHVD
jgi:hypothetical protein